jgi:putative SOS response-associated peptidase YedK
MMCGRYALWAISQLGTRFLIVDPMLGIRSRFNIAPCTENPVIVAADGKNQIRMMQWGLVPHQATGMTAANGPINARAESLREKPIFRNLVPGKRCIVPANGFYEWKKEGTRKVPFYFHRRDDPFCALAGLYDTWKDLSGETHLSYTIITTRANVLMAPVHNRMPVILSHENEERWLSPGALSPEAMQEILAPCDPGAMETCPVSSRVNSLSVDDERLILPVQGLG